MARKAKGRRKGVGAQTRTLRAMKRGFPNGVVIPASIRPAMQTEERGDDQRNDCVPLSRQRESRADSGRQ